MKKLLSAALALTMGVTCMALAACGGKEDDVKKTDAEIANGAISTIKVLYDKTALYETDGNFTVLGKTMIGGTLYDVGWSVSAEGNDISEYIKFSEMDDKNIITANVTRPDVDIEYKLTATVEVGKAKESYSFKRKLIAAVTKEDVDDGVEDNIEDNVEDNVEGEKIYSVAEILALDPKQTVELKSGNYTNPYYTLDGVTAAVVTVRGYVVDPGTYNSNYKNFNYVYIVDEYSSDKDKNSAGALQVYRIVRDSTYLKADGDLKKGDLVTLQGCVEFYKGNPELTYFGSVSVECLDLERN